jgi:hypothetical protein
MGWSCVKAPLAWLLAGCALLAAVPARAEEVALNWVRLDGAEACIAAPQLAELVEARIGRQVLQTPAHAELSIEARVGPQPEGGFRVVVTVNDRRGRRLGQRELRVADGPCSQLDRPASLIISLIIDPNAAGPGLLEGGALSPDAQRLLSQLELPSADPDELLASLDFVPQRRALRPVAVSSVPSVAKPTAHAPATPPPAKMVSVPEAEWRRLQALRGTTPDPEQDAAVESTPRWPGYALLGLSTAATATAVFALVRSGDLDDDSTFTRYRLALGRDAPNVTDVCAESRLDVRYGGLSAQELARVRDVCDEGELMIALFWISAGTAIAAAAGGAAWLLWVADDHPLPANDVPRATLSWSPAATPTYAGLQLRLRM